MKTRFTNAVGKGANRFGQLDDNSKNGTNDKDNNSKEIKKLVDRRKSHGGTGSYKMHAQDKLGWNLALEGVLTTMQWRMQQEQYWQLIKSQWSAKRWMSELIKKLWQVAWDMWRHQNSALHNMEAGKVLIMEGDINRTVIQVHLAGALQLLQSDLPIIRIPLDHLITGTLAYKQQWLESMEVAHTRFRRNRTKRSKNKASWKGGMDTKH